jgi:hypothetical protein
LTLINTPLSCDDKEEEIMMMGGACMVMSEEELIHKSRLSYSGICFYLPLATSLFCFHLPFELESWLFFFEQTKSWLFLFPCFFNFCFSPRPGKQNTTKPFWLTLCKSIYKLLRKLV